MAHFQNIRLLSHKGLKKAELHDLKKINVLCGSNNSGKTTVLECIADAKKHASGIAPSDALADKISHSSVRGAGWGQNDHYDRRYFAEVRAAIHKRERWFIGDETALLNLIVANWSQKFGNYANPANQLANAFKNAVTITPTVALIPAKRRLETAKPVAASDAILFDGTGVLNFLFSAKNQREDAETRLQFLAIQSAFLQITAGTHFDVFLRGTTEVELLFRNGSSPWLPAEDCGLGLRDLLVILYFSLASAFEVILIEEPENHLHPELQRRLINLLREHTDKQIFFSTHSSVFLSTHSADRVFLCKIRDGVTVENATSRAALLTELGYSISDNLVTDLVILCEGPTDKAALEEFFAKFPALAGATIKIWPLGGDIMNQLDLSVFSQSYKVMALIDNDPKSRSVRKDFAEKCKKANIPCHQLERYALENYFTIRAISSVILEPIPSDITSLDPNRKVYDQLGFEVKRNNAKISRTMTLEELQGTDLFTFLEEVTRLISS